MESIAVSVQNISKKFRLFNSPKERLLEVLHPFKKKYHREFWALTDINFEVEKGTTVGIIGRNGSGKSTLLQIICSILRPTSGIVTTNGRISSLLTLGAGFSPEFTGRDNVLMNGALMGFSTEEMKQRLPVIEAFADIGEFIDQPVKIYSSGMFVRLAFATAINVNPDILVVDEVLAVGDAKFQHKCFQKFLEFQESGKTIIFVTHNTDAIVRHCDYAILLERGEIIEMGEPKSITNYYLDLLFSGHISGYTFQPNLVAENFRGFNIVHYKTKYYGLSQSLGAVDVTCFGRNDLKEYAEQGKCVVGSSFEEAKQLVGQVSFQGEVSINQYADEPFIKTEKSELEKFLEEIPTVDNCIHRNGYNKNEYRIGDKRAEIIDYLTVSDGNIDLVTVKSGAMVEIYLKVKFHQDVEYPMFGFSIKSIDGIVVYASNTRYSKTPLGPAKKDDIIVFKFSMRLALHVGDFFVDLGFAEKLPDEDRPIDIRYSSIHFVVQPNNYVFDGFADFECTFQEVSRTAIRQLPA